jgi:ABC-type Fe3+-hydroxamate transport system substrate-binding protein
MEITDVRGCSFELDAPLRRVVSLVPSITETLFDLGAGESVVGRTDFCIFPPDPGNSASRVGGTKNPDVRRIEELRPDLVYMNLEENLRRHADAIECFAPVFVTEPKTVAGAVEVVRMLGAIHRREQQAAAWERNVENELQRLETAPRFSFACAIWKDPWMWCGGDTYVSDLITAAGGKNVFAGEQRYPARSFEDVRSLRPDVIFLPDEPFAFTEEDARALTPIAPRVMGPFPGHLVTWHGTRTLEGLRFLRAGLL